MRFAPLVLFGLVPSTLAAFGVTKGSNYLDVDTGNKFVYRVSTTNGDITSIKYNGKELQYSKKFTQIGSGLGSATVSSKVSGSTATITIATSTLTQYYVARSGQSALYIGTYITAEPSIGELRFIARLQSSVFVTSPASSNPRSASNLLVPNRWLIDRHTSGSAIEGSDVFLVSGQTRSNFYSSVRFIEDQVHGISGSGVGAYMVVPGNAYETSSGGPFFRDINNQNSQSDDGANEVYWYMNSNHAQTESYRTGFFGPYALVFTSGSAPSANLDLSCFADLGLKGYVASSGRGTVTGTVSGIPSGFQVVVGLKNSNAQYWGKVSGSSFSISGVKPGTYTATLFKKELEVGTGSVTVSAGKSSSLTLSSTESVKSTIWQIGVPDGTPSGFLNADKIETMHPSDSRMGSWGPVTYTIGSSSPSSFPMAQFIAVNNPTTIKWTASSSQIGARTLRIRTTSAFASARPAIKVNSWSSATPAAPTKVDSRGVTRGTWRGFNQLYEYAIPAGTLVAGSNSITITVASGSSGEKFLSPNIVYDSIELY
ncbi:rhamnogalacturonase B [Rhizoctonia solani]|uniref:rhamnogalacturonan endolyase n=1 Tax=Rhizoctonia solani TaxID=456999 RepID=A0A0K6FPA0_9AGAM|nr:rhamnogalacturonase B [Rhizoctonia solani]